MTVRFKLVLNALLGIGVEIVFASAVILAAYLICLGFVFL